MAALVAGKVAASEAPATQNKAARDVIPRGTMTRNDARWMKFYVDGKEVHVPVFK